MKYLYLVNMIHFLLFISWIHWCESFPVFTAYQITTHDTEVNLEGLNTFILQVKGRSGYVSHCGEVFARFITADGSWFTLFLDGWGGSKSAAQIKETPTSTVVEHIISNTNAFNLVCNEYKGFWVTWDSGKFKMGTGIIPGKNLVWDLTHKVNGDIPVMALFSSTRAYFNIALQTRVKTIVNNQHWTGEQQLLDLNTETCLNISSKSNFQMKMGFLFSNNRVYIIGNNLECGNLESFYVYVALQKGVHEYDGEFKSCKLMQEPSGSDQQTCVFDCDCQCEGIFVQMFNINENAKLCEVTGLNTTLSSSQ